jgi:hypothetical protein
MGEQSRLRMIGFRRIDALIEQHGTDEDGKPIDGEREFVENILAMVVEGDSLEVIARRFDVAYGSLWRWISGDKSRMAEYEAALKGHADKLVHETKGIADDSGDPKLRMDARKWLSGKWDSGRFGDKVQQQHGSGITVILAQTLADGGIQTIEGQVIEQVRKDVPMPTLKVYEEGSE